MVGKLQKAAVGYEEWKRSVSRFGPDFRPWLRPEQSFVPQIDRADVCASQAEVDEAHARNPTYADFGESVARLFREGTQPIRGQLAETRAGDNGPKIEEQQADVVDAELEREFAEAALQNGTNKRQNGEAKEGQFYDCQ